MTLTIVMNVLLGVALIGSLLWLLAHAGVAKDQHHNRRLRRWHRRRAAGHA
jgi:hypothetical protein